MREEGCSVNVREIAACRSCGSPDLTTVLDLGNLAVSDFVDDPSTLDRAPLELVRCAACTLVQLRHTVDRDRLYRTYHYRSGVNETMVAALADVVADATKRVVLEPGDAVLDIGCNDGTLLGFYPKDVHRIGFDPSDVAREAWLAKDFDYDLVRDFFPTSRQHTPVPCKVVTAIACFYDVDEPNTFLAEVKRWLHPEGVLVLQFQDFHSMARANGFDNICHEHLTYWSEGPLDALLTKHGLHTSTVSRVPVNGGSKRIVIKHGASRFPFRAAPQPDMAEFGERIRGLRDETCALLEIYRRQGKRVLGYAASTKANTLLQFYGLGPEHIQAFMERSPHKWGKKTTTRIPIVSEEEGRAMNPAFLFVGAWQFADAFAQREAALLANGTKLIVPLPFLRLVGGVGADVLAQVA
jgi:NDP-4-keto-2,6-dideoxyhexose 3-C-methyltransferase